jgi:acyl dehydratase
MVLHPSAVQPVRLELSRVGNELGPFWYEYGFRDVALYALAVGAGADDLAYLADDPVRKVLPCFAVVPTVEPVFAALAMLGAERSQMVQLTHRTEQLTAPPPSGIVQTRLRIRAVQDMVIGALVTLDTESTIDGRVQSRTRWQVLLRGAGRFGGERPGPGLGTRPPEGRPADFELDVSTHPTQALLYRLLGDMNPIHAAPDAAQRAGFERPILHGLCTYGIAARVALKAIAGDDPNRFRSFDARFAKVAFPGDTLRVRGYRLNEPGQVAVTVSVPESGTEVIANALLEISL